MSHGARHAEAPTGGAPGVLLSRPDARQRWDVLEEHLEEACFLWDQWEWAQRSARMTLAEVMRGPERRLRAHLEGLALGGPTVAERLVMPCLQEEDGARATVAALVLLKQLPGEGLAAVLALLRGGESAQRIAMGRALALSERPGLSMALLTLVTPEAAPEVLALVLDALRVRGDASGLLDVALLARLWTHPSSEVRRAALQSAAWRPSAGRVEVPPVRQGEPREVRAAALLAGVAHGQRDAWRTCLEVLEAPDAVGHMARLLVALSGERGAVARLTALLKRPALRAHTLWSLGFSGDVSAAEACLPWLADENVGALATEAFRAITGLALTGNHVRPPEETDTDEAPLEDGEPPSPLWPGGDTDLPLPAASEVERWWAGARTGFEAGTRYLRGQPFTAAGLVEALESAPMRGRGPLALELALRSGGTLAMELRTWARVQLQQLQAASGGTGGVRMRSLSS